MTTSAHSQAQTQDSIVRKGLHGIVAGLVGGMVFGMLMAMMGMLPMVAGLVGSTSAAVGGLVHMMISAGFGAAFGALWPATRAAGLLVGGALYGIIVWVVGALLIMPAWLGMPVFQINAMTMQSLMGHVIFGVVAGLVLWGFRRKAGSTS